MHILQQALPVIGILLVQLLIGAGLWFLKKRKQDTIYVEFGSIVVMIVLGVSSIFFGAYTIDLNTGKTLLLGGLAAFAWSVFIYMILSSLSKWIRSPLHLFASSVGLISSHVVCALFLLMLASSIEPNAATGAGIFLFSLPILFFTVVAIGYLVGLSVYIILEDASEPTTQEPVSKQ